MKFLPILYMIIFAFLAACSPAAAAAPESASGPEPATLFPDQPEPSALATGAWQELGPRLDEQGAVSVEVTPLNLDNPGKSLDFQVSMNTHSVDLSMDLADLASLTTDTGLTIQAENWDAPLGGHHVSGTLSFPSAAGGLSLLDGVSEITLVIDAVDGAVRTFRWEQ